MYAYLLVGALTFLRRCRIYPFGENPVGITAHTHKHCTNEEHALHRTIAHAFQHKHEEAELGGPVMGNVHWVTKLLLNRTSGRSAVNAVAWVTARKTDGLPRLRRQTLSYSSSGSAGSQAGWVDGSGAVGGLRRPAVSWRGITRVFVLFQTRRARRALGGTFDFVGCKCENGRVCDVQLFLDNPTLLTQNIEELQMFLRFRYAVGLYYHRQKKRPPPANTWMSVRCGCLP